MTVPLEPPGALATVGLSVSEAGACCVVNVTCDWRVEPFRLALIVTDVAVVTALVGAVN